MIDITLLGTSALLPLPDRALTSAYLACLGHGVLIDCGEGTQTAARRCGANILGAEIIALTHYHGDHIFGLPGLLQTMNSMGRTSPLYFMGPGDVEAALSPILRLAGPLGFAISVIPQGAQPCDVLPSWPRQLLLSAFPTRHRVPSQGYVLSLLRAGRFSRERAEAQGVPMRLWGRLQRGETAEEDGRLFSPDMVMGEARRGLKVVFSGDTAPCPELTEAAKDADLFLCEATYGEDEQAEEAVEWGHMTFALAAGTAKEAGARRLWLMHFSQRMEAPEEWLPNAQRYFEGAECGADGKKITLRYEDDAPCN
ncbi:MAG: ribonuclease Z [Clostridia bacterium]|nr:ribonuclease Z [Clostridia bacterium]